MTAGNELLRKQYLIRAGQVARINSLAASEEISAAEVVRRAIDAYDPEATLTEADIEALEVMRESVQEAVKQTEAALDELRALREQSRDPQREKERCGRIARYLDEHPELEQGVRSLLTGDSDHKSNRASA